MKFQGDFPVEMQINCVGCDPKKKKMAMLANDFISTMSDDFFFTKIDFRVTEIFLMRSNTKLNAKLLEIKT